MARGPLEDDNNMKSKTNLHRVAAAEEVVNSLPQNGNLRRQQRRAEKGVAVKWFYYGITKGAPFSSSFSAFAFKHI